ncbi:hypothetical protein [Herbiconiux ginsengi]|uniref:Uncharacterized protein n=1 Tax=Herbiconiux ginsengi TaxID=381665 RepID=A0A1H3LN25_9MICO|nr:hypothetical protein [Herbiconiux ginsengi]SDY65529.1 hypothetical protein SAMN05216554_1044 [Herbiconiux ginsengi]
MPVTIPKAERTQPSVANIRTALLAAAHVGVAIARSHDALEHARTAGPENHRWLFERLSREREAALASFARFDPNSSEPGELTRLYETARTWMAVDDRAAEAERMLRHHALIRYGIDIPPTH